MTNIYYIIFYILIVILNTTIVSSTNVIPNNCIFNFYGNAFNLSELMLPSSSGYRITSTDTDYYFNICELTNACPTSNSQSCQIPKNQSIVGYETGDINYGTYEFNRENNQLVLKYKTNDGIAECIGYGGRSTILNLKCLNGNLNNNKLYTQAPEISDNKCTYSYSVESSYACLTKGITIENTVTDGSSNKYIQIENNKETGYIDPIYVYHSIGDGGLDDGGVLTIYMDLVNGSKYEFTERNGNLETLFASKIFQYKLKIPYNFGNGVLQLSNYNYKLSVAFKFPKPTIETISLINLYSENGISRITITGKNYNSNSTNVKVMLLNQNCGNSKAISNTTITCDLNVDFIRNSNLESTVSFVKIDDVPTDYIGNINTFLPVWKKCPVILNQDGSNLYCSGNGQCDSSLNCICNNGYTSYDCSVEHATSDDSDSSADNPIPSTIAHDSFKLSNKLEQGYSISVHKIRNVNSNGLPQSTVSIKDLLNIKHSNFKDKTGFKTDGYTNSTLFSSLSISTSYQFDTNVNHFNFYGSNLPISNNSAVVSLEINNITSAGTGSTGSGVDEELKFIEIIYQISPIDGENQVEAQVVDNGYIVIREKRRNNLILFTISNRYPFANTYKLTNTLATSYILSSKQVNPNSSGNNTNDRSCYIAIQIPLINGSFEIGSSFNLYSNVNSITNGTDNDKWSNWKIYFIVACGVIGALLLLGTLLYVHQRSLVGRKIKEINSALRKSSRDAIILKQSPICGESISGNSNYINNNSADNNNNNRKTVNITQQEFLTPPPTYDQSVNTFKNIDTSEPLPNIDSITKPRSHSLSAPSTSTNSNRQDIESANGDDNNDDNDENVKRYNDKYGDVKITTIKVGEGCKNQ